MNFVLSILGFAQKKDSSILIGLVTIQNSGNKPAYPANIISNRSSPVVSLSKGDFKLVFYGMIPGERVRIVKVIYKNNNWIVANDMAMYTHIPAYPLSDTLKLYLCLKNKVEKKENKFIVNAMEVLDKKYAQELDSLKRAGAMKDNEIMVLESKYESLKVEIFRIARTYARVNFDFASEIDSSYYKLFQDGDYQLAALLYKNPEKKIDSIDLLIATENKVHTDNMQALLQDRSYNVNAIIKQYEAFKMDFKWESAEERIMTAYKVDSLNYKIVNELAEFSDSQRDFDKTNRWLSKSVSLSRDWYDSAWNVLYLSELYTGFKEYESFKNLAIANSLISNATQLLYNIKDDDTVRIRKAYSNLYNHKLSYFYYSTIYDSALFYSQLDLNLIEAGMKSDPEYWEFFLGMGYHNRGEQFLRLVEFGKSSINSEEYYTGVEKKVFLDSARKYFLDAYSVKLRLKKEQKLNTLSRIAYTCNSLAIVYGYMDSVALQKKYFNKSFSIYSELYKKAHKSYEAFIKMSYENLLDMHAENSDRKEIYDFYKQTQDVRATIYKDTLTYNVFLCRAYSQLIYKLKYNSAADLEKILAKAIICYQKVIGKDTLSVKSYLAFAFYTLAENYFNNNVYEKAKAYFLKVNEIYNYDDSKALVELTNSYLKRIADKEKK